MLQPKSHIEYDGNPLCRADFDGPHFTIAESFHSATCLQCIRQAAIILMHKLPRAHQPSIARHYQKLGRGVRPVAPPRQP